MRILGIDPGAHGALALLDGETLLDVWDMPTVLIRRGKRDVHQVDSILLYGSLRSRGAIDLAVIEAVHSMPGQGVSSMFAFGRSVGVLEGVFGAMEIRYITVAPQRWKKAMGVNSAKDSSRHKALHQWPALAERFARVKDDGRAEAALIGLYGARQH